MRKTTIGDHLASFEFPGGTDAPGNSGQIRKETLDIGGARISKYTGEFWTSRQRQAHSLHEISYRACYKPQLPSFFIERLTDPGDIVYDPFSGRGTTILEAALTGRNVIASDINPLSRILSRPRLEVPDRDELAARLGSIPMVRGLDAGIDLSMFYHPDTLSEILSIRHYLEQRAGRQEEDHIDRWIRMVATNRLTGHSPGFFSGYTLPPNQAVSRERQVMINRKRDQVPGYRDTRQLILKKSRQLLSRVTHEQVKILREAAVRAIFLTQDARSTPAIPDSSIMLTVTSPPFLDVVQYAADNWLRCWFNHIDAAEVAGKITMARNVSDWVEVMESVFRELYRITKASGHVAFEVGEIRGGQLRLEEYVVGMGLRQGFQCEAVMINDQAFTKTANIWGVSNNSKGTNSNRIVVFRKG